jgi:uncharacterized protein
MKTLVIADEESVELDNEDRADLLISCGDIDDDFILKVADMTLARRILAVKGNHDSYDAFEAPIVGLHLKVHEYRGIKFGGFNGGWRYKPRGDHLYDQGEVEKLLRNFPPVDVFVAHNSPRHIHEWDYRVHKGFEAFNDYIARARPQVFIHGHQHVNAETLIGQTRVVGVFGRRWIRLTGAR